MNRLMQLQAAADMSAQTGSAPPAPGTEAVGSSSDATSAPRHTTVTFKEPESDENAATTAELATFFQEVELVLSQTNQISELYAQIESKHAENMQVIDEGKSAAIRSELEDMASQVNELAQKAKGKLETMQKATEELRASPELEQANAGVVKIRQNQHSHLLRLFVETMQAYQRVQATSEQRYREQTERRIKIRYTNSDGTAIDDATARELALEVLEQGTTNAIFQQSKDTLAQIIETRNDIYRIEQSMRELNQLFNDLAILVNEQGELMDVILQNVRSSVTYVQKGRKELKKARSYQKKSRKKLVCLIVCVVVIIALFLLAGILGGTL